MGSRAIVVLIMGLGILPLGSCDPCDKFGHAYTCTCTKRCNGVTTTTTESLSCVTGDEPSGDVTESCEDSCSPSATCSCTCTRGAECTLETECS